MKEYNHKKIEAKWRKYWDDNNTFYTDVYDFSKPKYYVLDMFPYPSGQGLHVGHVEGYTATDIIARKKRMEGYNVLHPMGFDAFGLPAEQYAISTGNHPGVFTKKNINTFKQQLKLLGFSYDWTKEISTCDPAFYKWTQWIFKLLYEEGLACYKSTLVNWCEELGTVLANDEIVDGKSERGGYPVVQKEMKQWVINLPSYAEKLIDGLNDIDWPNYSKSTQINWIGKRQGVIITFKVKECKETLKVFTTRCDTIFGVTYCVISPNNPLALKICVDEKKEILKKYTDSCRNSSNISKEKTGLFIGRYAINPLNNQEVPIYVSDYVSADYGTGVVMGVPAHDMRDNEFALKYHLPIIKVIDTNNCLNEDVHINSEFINGLNTADAMDKVIEFLENKKLGYPAVSYHIKDWVFSRQRYWGEPIPVIHFGKNTKVLEDCELPLLLPELENYKTKSGTCPLDTLTEWKNVKYDNEFGERETSTMPGSAGSSWYYLRYIDPHNDNSIADFDLLKHWMPVDLYVGGPEHLVGHLLYARFINNFLYDKKVVPTKEPFKKLYHQGMILGENGEKMSKSRGNVVNPNDVVAQYGADVLRMYEMFMGPVESTKSWNDKNIIGIKKFIDKVFNLYFNHNCINDDKNCNLNRSYNKTVYKVSNDYDLLKINTAISQMMIFVSDVYKEISKGNNFPKSMAEGFIKLMSPITPFIAEEIWHCVLGHDDTICYANWPSFDSSLLYDDEYEMIIQANNKNLCVIKIPSDYTETQIKSIAINCFEKKFPNTDIKRVIFVKNKLINFVF